MKEGVDGVCMDLREEIFLGIVKRHFFLELSQHSGGTSLSCRVYVLPYQKWLQTLSIRFFLPAIRLLTVLGSLAHDVTSSVDLSSLFVLVRHKTGDDLSLTRNIADDGVRRFFF